MIYHGPGILTGAQTEKTEKKQWFYGVSKTPCLYNVYLMVNNEQEKRIFNSYDDTQTSGLSATARSSRYLKRAVVVKSAGSSRRYPPGAGVLSPRPWIFGGGEAESIRGECPERPTRRTLAIGCR